jgi:hypothetical protein
MLDPFRRHAELKTDFPATLRRAAMPQSCQLTDPPPKATS